jgi:hypothetical protein
MITSDAIKQVISNKIQKAQKANRDLQDATQRGIQKKAKADLVKAIKLTPAQTQKVVAELLGTGAVYRETLLTGAQKVRVNKILDRMNPQGNVIYDECVNQNAALSELEQLVIADLDMCRNESEQRKTLQRFQTHNLDLPWKLV